jgi:hypothetical protein
MEELKSLCNSVLPQCPSVLVLFLCYTEIHREYTESHRETRDMSINF